jgi:hypothetical protein
MPDIVTAASAPVSASPRYADPRTGQDHLVSTVPPDLPPERPDDRDDPDGRLGDSQVNRPHEGVPHDDVTGDAHEGIRGGSLGGATGAGGSAANSPTPSSAGEPDPWNVTSGPQDPWGPSFDPQAPQRPEPWPVTSYDDNPDPRIDPLSIASIVFAFLCSPIGFVLGLMSRGRISRQPQQYKGMGLATAGIALSAVFFLLGLLNLLAGR